MHLVSSGGSDGHSKNQSPSHFVPHFLSLESTTGMNFTNFCFILLDILPSGVLYMYI